MTREPASEHEPAACDSATARAFDFLGKRWSGVILGTLTNGASGFAQLRRSIPGISDSMLSERLTELAAAGLIERSVDVGPPVSVDYHLTPSGDALLPALRELSNWAKNYLPSA